VGQSNPTGATSESQSDAVVWQPSTNGGYTLSDLNNLIPAGTGWLLTRADGVNDSGQIVAEATNGTSYHALLLTPAGPNMALAQPAGSTPKPTVAGSRHASTPAAQALNGRHGSAEGNMASPLMVQTPGSPTNMPASPPQAPRSAQTSGGPVLPGPALTGSKDLLAAETGGAGAGRQPRRIAGTPADLLDQVFAEPGAGLSGDGWGGGPAFTQPQ
jgi:hypothetical protein